MAACMSQSDIIASILNKIDEVNRVLGVCHPRIMRGYMH